MGFKRVARSIGTRLVRRRPLLLPQLERRRELDFYCLVSDSRSFECVPPRSKLGITPESPSHSSAQCQEHSKFLACITFHRFGAFCKQYGHHDKCKDTNQKECSHKRFPDRG